MAVLLSQSDWGSVHATLKSGFELAGIEAAPNPKNQKQDVNRGHHLGDKFPVQLEIICETHN